MNLVKVYARLRHENRKNYFLLLGCCFFSVLLITAYLTMMRTPTVLNVLPEGGDSRKQVMAIFVLVTLGCAAFTIYASGLFFRSKSGDTGVFLALGASRRQMKRLLYRELALIAFVSCGAGTLLGAPLAWGLWQLFRLLVVDTREMTFLFEPLALLFAFFFSIFVILMLFGMGARFIRRTNIIDIVNEARKSEPIRAVPQWYGWRGIGLMLLGGILGRVMPVFFIRVLHWYSPEYFSIIFYTPVFAGLYMVLLHTVVNGWGRRHTRFKNIISISMMKFQGRQTVRNMLVMTVLLAGAYFAMFYAPMLGTGSMLGYDRRPTDYVFHYRMDQNMIGRADTEALAQEYGVTLKAWREGQCAILGQDGMEYIEEAGAIGGITWHQEYRELLGGDRYMPESVYNRLTGDSTDVRSGTFQSVSGADGEGEGYMISTDQTLLHNMVTGEKLTTAFAGYLRNDMLAAEVHVLDDADYNRITEGLTSEWLENYIFFDDSDTGNLYSFSKALFYAIVDRSGAEVEQGKYWDQVAKKIARDAGEPYGYDKETIREHGFAPISYDQRDSSEFRLSWLYMPKFRVLDKADFVRTTAVYLMLFIFIAIICFAAVIVIAYTRCLTIALNNRQVYDDLRHLGADGNYLRRSVRGQVSRVFLVPALVGTITMFVLYSVIIFFNDGGKFTAGELAGMGNCTLLVAACSILLYGVYWLTYNKTLRILEIKRP